MTTDNWTANGIGDWATGPDWSQGTPTNGTDAFIGTGMGGLVISNADVTVNSLGVSSAYTLEINSGGHVFTATNGAGAQEIIGAITIADSSTLKLGNNTFENFGTVQLQSTGDPTNIAIVGIVDLTGSGSIEFEPGVSGSQNGLFGVTGSAELNNFGNDISGTGVIENVFFTNEAHGIIETNNNLGTGFMQIWGTAPFGTPFVNAGTVRADNGGTLQLGEKAGVASTINNDALMDVLGTNQKTDLYIQGNVTINQSSSGEILLGGSDPAFDFIVSNGIVGAATLTINGGLIAGAGDIGDNTALQVTFGVGTTVDADNPNFFLSLDAGSLAINNLGQIEAAGGKLEINCVVNSRTNGGVVSIDSSGTLYMPSAGSINGNLTFNGANAMLELINSSQISGFIAGAAKGDSIEFLTTTFVSGTQAVWQQSGSTGTLSLVSNGSTVATLTLAGHYTSSDFVAVSTNSGNSTQINIVGNPLPPSGTTAVMIMDQPSSGNYEIYDIGNNAVLAAYPLTQATSPWRPVYVGGFDGSDTSDLLLRNGSTGAFDLYDVSGNAASGPVALGAVGTDWSVLGFGDFSGNPGETDMLMRQSSTAKLEVYDISNNQITGAASMGAVGPEWNFLGVGDFSSNANETDLLMRDSNNGALEVYNVSHNAIVGATGMGAIGVEWNFVGVGDFSGNAGETDMLMRDQNNGALEVYNVHNDQIVGAQAMGAVGLEWSVVGIGDFSGNSGETDMITRNANTGAFEIYDISHDSIASASSIGAVGTDWQTAGIAAYQSAGAAIAASGSSQPDSVALGAEPLSSGQVGGAAPAAEISAPTWAAGDATSIVAGNLFQHA